MTFNSNILVFHTTGTKFPQPQCQWIVLLKHIILIIYDEKGLSLLFLTPKL